MPQPHSNWKLKLEFQLDDGEGESTTAIQLDGNWVGNSGQRDAVECVARDMGAIIKMLESSGNVIGASGVDDIVSAFNDAGR